MNSFTILLLVFLCISSCSSQKGQNAIVLVNIDTLSRSEIAQVIVKIDSLTPGVVGLDIMFNDRTRYEDDLKLISALYSCNNLVMGRLIKNYSTETNYHDQYVSLPPEFVPENARYGFINAILNDKEHSMLSRFSVKEMVKNRVEYHFSIRVAMTYDSLKTIDFINSHSRFVEVDFKAKNRDFKVFSSTEVLRNRVVADDIRGKIVLIGFLGPGDEDRFSTPLTKDPTERDIYGLQFLAYIIAQVLEYDE